MTRWRSEAEPLASDRASRPALEQVRTARSEERDEEEREEMASGRERRRAWGGLGGFVEIGEPFSTPPAPTNRMPSSFPPGDALAPRIDGAPRELELKITLRGI